MKKTCQCCGRNRRIGKFGRLTRSSDGKNPYCRDCMKDFRDGYRCTLKGRRKVKAAKKKYNRRNKQKISEYNKEYYLKNKDRIKFNAISRKSTECILITENSQKRDKPKINKTRKLCTIVIDPKRK